MAGDGIAKSAYTWPTLVFGPRVGLAYDVTGDQGLVVRGGIGLFYDQGYFKQQLDEAGWQREEYIDTKVENVPMEPALSPDAEA